VCGQLTRTEIDRGETTNVHRQREQLPLIIHPAQMKCEVWGIKLSERSIQKKADQHCRRQKEVGTVRIKLEEPNRPWYTERYWSRLRLEKGDMSIVHTRQHERQVTSVIPRFVGKLGVLEDRERHKSSSPPLKDGPVGGSAPASRASGDRIGGGGDE